MVYGPDGKVLDLGTKVITMRVCRELDDYKDFTVHENLIRAHSPFVDAAMRGDWKEASERMVKMRGDPACFQLYVQWLYSRQVIPYRSSTPWMKGSDRSSPAFKAFDEPFTTAFGLLVRSWILGDLLQDINFQDATMDACAEMCDDRTRGSWSVRIPGALVNHVYAYTTETSPLRLLLVHHAIVNRDTCIKAFKTEDYPSQFLTDMVVASLSPEILDESVSFDNDIVNVCEMRHLHRRRALDCYKTNTPKPTGWGLKYGGDPDPEDGEGGVA
ncbi:hypothetical protein BU16DRAFT_1972 [Lophium mytilinum]|uniref:BTB domain-containing protein n=1 Tax=Lophium mytilinum TaxID=390894 RepID=A0A6A6RCN4_9PEZI|nr:hypothetical protein BU16DRAFT_1972 [Lophium mytilinum]